MTACPSCGHHNLPGYPNCSKCGTSLSGAPAAGPSDYERLMAGRAAAAKKKQLIYLIVGGVLVLGVGWKLWQDRALKAATQVKLDFFERWANLEKKETGAYWNCLMASEVDVGMFANGQQIQQRVEGAYATQPKTYADYLISDCVPKAERAKQAMGSLSAETPEEFKAPLAAYVATLPGLVKGTEDYAEKVKNRGATKDLDAVLQEVGGVWHAEQKPTPQTIAFDKFLACAIPGLDKLKDAQALLEVLADSCYKKDAVAFMDRIRKDCGALLQSPDAAAKPSKEYKARIKKFYEEEQRQMQAWESCSKRSRKGKKAEDMELLLTSAGDYIKARTDVAKVAKALAGAGGEGEGKGAAPAEGHKK
jgi:hypothetical protein